MFGKFVLHPIVYAYVDTWIALYVLFLETHVMNFGYIWLICVVTWIQHLRTFSIHEEYFSYVKALTYQ
jgi:hypothetical protein